MPKYNPEFQNWGGECMRHSFFLAYGRGDPVVQAFCSFPNVILLEI